MIKIEVRNAYTDAFSRTFPSSISPIVSLSSIHSIIPLYHIYYIRGQTPYLYGLLKPKLTYSPASLLVLY